MKTDVQGCSTCPRGGEHYEECRTPLGPAVQYDYRTPDGRLFSCVSATVERARAARDVWLRGARS